MRRKPHIVTVAASFALMACNPSAPPNGSADTGRNVAAPATQAAPSAPAAPAESNAEAPGQTNAVTAASGNGLWGVAEAEDEASHRGIDFIAFNRTGRTIAALSIRPDEGPLAPGASQDPWSANVLAQSELPDGQRAASHFEADIELCRWQLRATFADRKTRDYPGVNLCDTIRVDLR
jgi:hypothetical protein